MNLDTNKNIYIDLLDTLNNGKKAVIVTTLHYNNNKYSSSRNSVLFTEDSLLSAQTLDNDLHEKAKSALVSGNLQLIDNPEQEAILIEPYFPEPNLIVLGGGHIAKPLVEFASKTGFKITVVDDRPTFANTNRFPGAEKVICESFENCFPLLNLNSSSYVVIITRGHRHDLHCLRESLKYDTAYIGMIGSKRRTKVAREQLLDEGYLEEQLNKLNAPIGLDIGAVSPEEIAISILAQLISYRRKRQDAPGSPFADKITSPEFDSSVIEVLSKDSKEPKAVATIISSKGSVPRKAGAKMIIYPDGRTLGSIGGGCSEGEVITTARAILKTGGYQIQEVDMTGIVAEDEGMVCGGTMKVLIESITS